MRITLFLLICIFLPNLFEVHAQSWNVKFFTQDGRGSQIYAADEVLRKPGQVLELSGLRTLSHQAITRPSWRLVPQSLLSNGVGWDSLDFGPEFGGFEYRSSGPPDLTSPIPKYMTSFVGIDPDEERIISQAFASVGPQSPAHTRFQTFASRNVIQSSSLKQENLSSSKLQEEDPSEEPWIVTLYTANGNEAQSFEAVKVWQEFGVLAVEVEDPIEDTWTVKMLRQDTTEVFSTMIAEEKPTIEHGLVHFFGRSGGGVLQEVIITQPFIVEGPTIYIGSPAIAKRIIQEASTLSEWLLVE